LKKKIAICIPCYNEEKNIEELYYRIYKVIKKIENYNFSIIFADNCSTDNSMKYIKKLIQKDKRVGYILNVSNFGFVRSSANVLLAPDADANIFLMSDLQDPPELIPNLIKEWEETDNLVVFAVRKSSRENKILFLTKKIYYSILSKLSNQRMVKDTTGFGIYDKKVIKTLRDATDSYPFIKGLVCAIGFKWGTIPYISSQRKTGKSSASLSFLIDFGVLGIVTSSRKPMRIITMLGLSFGLLSILLSVIVIITKLVFWDKFAFGIAMLSTANLLFTGAILSALGIIGEYIGFINQRSLKFPLIIERERVNVPQETNN
tara:strand:- start:446 stop:1399 length:954 start_codon:yes stop_codon:yes gene_type:complete